MNVEIKSKCLRDNSSNRNMDEEWEKQIKNWKETKRDERKKETKEKKKRNKAKDNVLGCIKNESEKQKKKNLKRKSETRRMEKSLIKKARI